MMIIVINIYCLSNLIHIDPIWNHQTISQLWQREGEWLTFAANLHLECLGWDIQVYLGEHGIDIIAVM